MSKMEGTIVAADMVKKSAANWATWQVQFDTGESVKCAVGPNEGYNLASGDWIKLREGKFNPMVIEHRPGGSAAAPTSPKKEYKGGGKSSGGGMSRDDYFQRKFDYEVRQRDTQIAIQSIAGIIAPLYLQKLSKSAKPTDVMVDAAVDAMFVKAREITVDNKALTPVVEEVVPVAAEKPKKEKKKKGKKKSKKEKEVAEAVGEAAAPLIP